MNTVYPRPGGLPGRGHPTTGAGVAWPAWHAPAPTGLGVGYSKRTKTNAPLGWMAHTLMGRNGFLPAQRSTRN